MTTDYNDLQAQMLRSAKFDEEMTWALSLSSIAIPEETGEILGLIKKIFYHHHGLDDSRRAKLIEEGGDLLWYECYLAHYLGIGLDRLINEMPPSGFDFKQKFDDRWDYSEVSRKLAEHAGGIATTLSYILDYVEWTDGLSDWFVILVGDMQGIAFWLGKLAILLGSSLEEMCRVNIEKLRKRYPEGWNVEASLHRADLEAPAG